MKKTIVFVCLCCLIILGLQGFAQNKHCATSVWITEKFGERFISSAEAGFGELIIPFTEEELQYDDISWIMPLKIDGVLQYKLIQARYSLNQYERHDTLSLKEATEVIDVMKNAGRIFPGSNSVEFFLTKDKIKVNEKNTFYFALACRGNEYEVISLPKNTQIVSANQSIMLVEDEIVINTGEISTEFGNVMTLVRLK
jgi:hypothetical protein